MKTPPPDRIFLLYGDWTDGQGLNFVYCRCPGGRVPWSRKIAPALQRLVRRMHGGARNRPLPFWSIDGLPAEPGVEQGAMWDSHTQGKARRFRWDGAEFVEVP